MALLLAGPGISHAAVSSGGLTGASPRWPHSHGWCWLSDSLSTWFLILREASLHCFTLCPEGKRETGAAARCLEA